MGIILIAVVDMNLGIGDGKGNLLFDLPRDMKHFKDITTNKTVVMGRKTWESLSVRPLPKRKNYVLTMNEEYEAEGATVLHDIQEVLDLAKTKDVYVIGGAELYYQLIDDADELIITHVHVVDFNAKVHFPDFGHKDWAIQKGFIAHKADEENEHDLVFAHYKRN